MKSEKELQALAATELSDLCTELWFNYGTATKASDKKVIREEYNAVAQHYNKRVGWKCMSMITDATKPQPEMNERIEKNQHPTGAKPITTVTKEEKATTSSSPKTKSGGNIIQQILALHKAGKTNAEIIAAGFNKSTVSRQVSEYKKSNNGK